MARQEQVEPTAQELMDHFLDTVSFDEVRPWQEMPETGEDPDDDEALVPRTLGGPGSGNFGHGGRPGEVGGSTSSGLSHEVSHDPVKETRAHGTVVAKSKYGAVEIVRSIAAPTAPHRYLGRRKSGESVGTFSKLQSAMDALRAPTNTQHFASGHRREDVEWKVLGGPGSGNFGHAGRPGERGGSSSEGGEGGKAPSHESLSKGTQNLLKGTNYYQGAYFGTRKHMEEVQSRVGGKLVEFQRPGMGNSPLWAIEHEGEKFGPPRRVKKAPTEHPGGAIVKRSRTEPGEVHVTFPDKRQYVIYKDSSSGLGQWEVSGAEDVALGISAFTREEMIAGLAKLDESRPAMSKHHGMQRSPTIKEHLARKRSQTEFRTSELATLGGPGSGNFGHGGRPGQVGGSSSGEGSSADAQPVRPDPTKDEIKQVYELRRQGHSDTQIATKLGWGGKSGSRHEIVKNAVSKYDEEGNVKEGHTPFVRTPKQVKVKESAGETPKPPQEPRLPKEMHKPYEPIENLSSHQVNDVSHGQVIDDQIFDRMTPHFNRVTDNKVFATTTFKNATGHKVKVLVERGTNLEKQRELRYQIAHTPQHVFEAAGEPELFMLKDAIKFTHKYGSQKGGSEWEAAGVYYKPINIGAWQRTARIEVAAPEKYNYGQVTRTLMHELGHGIDETSVRHFGRKAVSAAFRADRKHQRELRQMNRNNVNGEFTYFRALKAESFAESIGTHLGGWTDHNRSARFQAQFPNMRRLVAEGMKNVYARKVKAKP